MAKKLEVIGKKAHFTMSLKGGDLPSNYEVEIAAVMDFTGATEAQLIRCAASGQSARVALQSQLRRKPIAVLNGHAKDGLNVKFTDVIAGDVASPTDRLLALSQDDFVEMMIKEFDLPREQAIRIYCHKHGLTYEPAGVEPNGSANPIE